MKQAIKIFDTFFISFVIAGVLTSLFAIANKESLSSTNNLFLLGLITYGAMGTGHRVRFPIEEE